MTEAGGGPGHRDLAEELRRYAEAALDLLQPWVDRIREQRPGGASAQAVMCPECPVCAVATVLRGGRSELVARWAEQATGMLAVLRTALEEGVGTPTSPPRDGATPDPPPPGPRRRAARSRPATEPRAATHRDQRPHPTSPSGRGRSGRTVQRIEITGVEPGGRGEPARAPC